MKRRPQPKVAVAELARRAAIKRQIDEHEARWQEYWRVDAAQTKMWQRAMKEDDK